MVVRYINSQKYRPPRRHKFDSTAWYNWLDQHSTFLFRLPFVHFTARKEKRAGGLYWYAYRRSQGKLRTAYLGKTRELTFDRLSAVAAALDL